MKKNYKIAYLVSDLKRVGPSNQTLNIIKYSNYRDDSIVITLFSECEDSMIEEYKNENIPVISLKLNKLNYMLTGQKILCDILRKNNIKILHSYGIRPDRLGQRSIRNLDIKHIITLRNYPKEDILTRMPFLVGYYAYYQHMKVLKKSENLICCSKSIFEKISNDYNFKNISYIRNGVDLEKFSRNKKMDLAKSIGINENEKVFISTGSFIKRKRIQETIDLFNVLPEKNKHLLLLGTGELFDLIKNSNRQKNIHFLGKTNNVRDYLSISDYFISSSESEGLPNSVIEAIACELPVILSNIPQHAEIFEVLGVVGILYNIGEINDAKQQYIQYISHNQCIVKDNIKRIKNSELEMKQMSTKYSKLYIDMLGD